MSAAAHTATPRLPFISFWHWAKLYVENSDSNSPYSFLQRRCK